MPTPRTAHRRPREPVRTRRYSVVTSWQNWPTRYGSWNVPARDRSTSSAARLGQRAAIGPDRADRVVDVGNRRELAGQRRGAPDADGRVVGLAVVPEVMLEGDQDREGRAVGERAELPRAELRVARHGRPLVPRELARLVQDVQRDSELADVVQQGRHADGMEEGALEPESAGLGQDEERDVDGMDERVLVVRLQRHRRKDGLGRPRHRIREAPDQLLDGVERRHPLVTDAREHDPARARRGARTCRRGPRPPRSPIPTGSAAGCRWDSDLDLADHDVRGRLGPLAGRQRVDQGAALVEIQVARRASAARPRCGRARGRMAGDRARRCGGAGSPPRSRRPAGGT